MQHPLAAHQVCCAAAVAVLRHPNIISRRPVRLRRLLPLIRPVGGNRGGIAHRREAVVEAGEAEEQYIGAALRIVQRLDALNPGSVIVSVVVRVSSSVIVSVRRRGHRAPAAVRVSVLQALDSRSTA